MRILAILGSPKGNGNTTHGVEQIAARLKALGGDITVDYLSLKEAGLEPCRGCFACLAHGETYCPLRDSRAQIEARMQQADGVIFASPTYVYNVSWLMKNFIDRFAYVCHRPRFHGKPALVLTTTGAVGAGVSALWLAFAAQTWGFTISDRVGLQCPPVKLPAAETQRLEERTRQQLDRAAGRFYRALGRGKQAAPGLLNLAQFLFQREAFRRGDPQSCDYRYWQAQGWLDPRTSYFYPVHLPPARFALAWLAARILLATIPKPPPARLPSASAGAAPTGQTPTH